MLTIINNIRIFYEALKVESGLRVDSEGSFYVRCKFTSLLSRFFGLERKRWFQISCVFRKVLNELETVPVVFSAADGSATQEVDYQWFIESASLIIENLELLGTQRAAEEGLKLKRELLALLYRLEEANGGLSPSASPPQELVSSLVEAARSWKSSQVLFHNSTLSFNDINILQDACHYTEFAKLLLRSKELLEDFLIWALRDRIPAASYIEFPSITQKIKDFDLNGRIGRLGGGHLKVLKNQNVEGAVEKVVTLPFEGKDISILDENRYILFRGDYALQIKDVFDEFGKKLYGDTNLELMEEGIINWNTFHWGWWDERIQDYHLVDLDKPEWWKQLPAFEVLSLKEVRQKYGRHADGRQWIVASVATRERATLDFESAHAFSILAIPVGDGRYAIYPFGKYAMKFPPSLLQALANIGEISRGTVAFPDENVFYTHRQSASLSFAISEEQGMAYLNSIRRDMLLSRADNLVYQIESENCAKWAHQKIEEIVGPHRIPNVFQMPFLNSEPHGFMEKIFKAIKTFPETWHIPITLCIHFIFGAYKGFWIWEEGKKTWKSLTHHPFWNDTVIYHPSMLHKQQELGILQRMIPQGVVFNKETIHESYHGLAHKWVLFEEFILDAAVAAWKALVAFLEDLLLAAETRVVVRSEISTSSITPLNSETSLESPILREHTFRLETQHNGMERALT